MAGRKAGLRTRRRDCQVALTVTNLSRSAGDSRRAHAGDWYGFPSAVVAPARIRTAALRRRLSFGCWLLAVRTDCLPLQQLHLFPQPLANSRLIAEPGGNHLMHAGVGFDRLFRA